jgi:hypothetical protein
VGEWKMANAEPIANQESSVSRLWAKYEAIRSYFTHRHGWCSAKERSPIHSSPPLCPAPLAVALASLRRCAYES